jgi:hypothetical protein
MVSMNKTKEKENERVCCCEQVRARRGFGGFSFPSSLALRLPPLLSLSLCWYWAMGNAVMGNKNEAVTFAMGTSYRL